MINEIIQGDALTKLRELQENTADLLVTDPPYGYAFMNKDWDKAVVSVDIWRECLRVLKPGAFAFIMSSPRQDVLCKMILNLIDVGFETNFTSIYWAYASGFPKAADVSKLVDKRGAYNMSGFARMIKQRRQELGLSQKDVAKHFPSRTGGITGCVWNWENLDPNPNIHDCIPTIEQFNKLVEVLKLDKTQYPELQEAERQIIGTQKQKGNIGYENEDYSFKPNERYITKPATEQAKKLEGSYAGFQPKPAVELILVCMKPLDQKTYVDQALANQKGITWLDDCRIPYQNENDLQIVKDKQAKDLDKWKIKEVGEVYGGGKGLQRPEIGEFGNDKGRFPANLLVSDDVLNDGHVIRANQGINKDRPQGQKFSGYRTRIHAENNTYNDSGSFSRYFSLDKWTEKTFPFLIVPKASKAEKQEYNRHPTVKPLQLMSYLITMGSRPNDIVLDPFAGSGSTLIATYQLARNFIGIEVSQEYIDIANKRLERYIKQQRITEFE